MGSSPLSGLGRSVLKINSQMRPSESHQHFCSIMLWSVLKVWANHTSSTIRNLFLVKTVSSEWIWFFYAGPEICIIYRYLSQEFQKWSSLKIILESCFPPLPPVHRLLMGFQKRAWSLIISIFDHGINVACSETRGWQNSLWLCSVC